LEEGPTDTGTDWGFLEEGPPDTGTDWVFVEEDPPDTGPDWVSRPVSCFSKKSCQICPNFFFLKFRRTTGKGMTKEQVSSVTSEEVSQVESKWPFLPIYPTYDQYEQQFMTMSQREGFHVLTRSVMKELRDHTKWMVLHDNHKKHVFFEIRVDVWRRSDNLPEDRANFVQDTDGFDSLREQPRSVVLTPLGQMQNGFGTDIVW
jgi:hypothetical protein